MVNEELFVENKDKREEMINRIEVLDKVKELILLPNTEFASVEMVAKYYEVPVATIKSLIYDNKDELDSDGYGLKSRQNVLDVLKFPKETLKTFRGKTVVSLNNDAELIIPNRGLRTFPKRAILRVGMLLRDSAVAKEVRSQLLNILETTQKELPKEIITKEIDKENKLMLDVINAEDKLSAAIAMREYKNYKNNTIKALQGDIEEWEPLELVRKVVNKLSNGYNYGIIWNKLYNDLHYRYKILVHGRKKPKNGSLLDTLDDNEKIKLVQVAVSRAIKEKVDIADVLEHKPNDLEIDLK